MKGISHFAVGVAAASFFPEAVRSASEGNPLYFILGGVFGLLPDTMDFKFWRFFYRHDIEVIPDPLRPDARMIADAVACAINRAGLTRKPVRIKLNTIRLAGDSWRRYEIRLDPAARRVAVKYGPVVNTSCKPDPSFEVDDTDCITEAEAPVDFPIVVEYKARTPVDILDGPVFEMTPINGGRVVARFIPWHRTWTHSLVTGAALGVLGAAIWNLVAGLVITAACFAHVFVDQLGFLGSSLFYPISAKRTAGLRLAYSQNPVSNFAAVWLSCVLVFWNLYRASPVGLSPHALPRMIVYGFMIPIGILILLHKTLLKEEADS